MTGKFLFSTLEDERLVEAVAQYSCLYDSSDKEFKSQQSRENAWSKIGARVGRNGKISFNKRSNFRNLVYNLWVHFKSANNNESFEISTLFIRLLEYIDAFELNLFV